MVWYKCSLCGDCAVQWNSTNLLNFSLYGLDLIILSASLLGVKEVLPNSQPVYEDQTYLQSQTGTTLLDKFTYCLLVKCSAEVCTVY